MQLLTCSLCVACSRRSWDLRAQQSPLTVIPPRSRGARALGSACGPSTPSEGERDSLLNSSSSKGNEIFPVKFDSAWQYIAIGQFKVVSFTWEFIKILILRFSKILCS